MAAESFDLTPDPKVLIALTRTPLQPLDALCELIDNAIDSFHAARIQGIAVDRPLVSVRLPRASELKEGQVHISIRDNGIGLSRERAEEALRAGFSGNNPYDSLGLFGMGFNIATGKLGRTTRFFTARKQDDTAVDVTVDLEQIRASKQFKVPFKRPPKPTPDFQGTEVQISDWWPDGDANSGFVRKLVQYGIRTIRSELGRRYSTILQEGRCRLLVNDEECTPFEHCIWSGSRFVERKGVGKIQAKIDFDQLIGTQKRCTQCTALVAPEGVSCPLCGSASFRSIEERIRGWVGIQRFDHPTDFGVDLIRNGRAIRISEKAAFFDFTDELKHSIKDYPVDSPYGRIVGVVHLDHIPVDFLKQDFQRSTPEWARAMTFLRGDSSLQPSQPNADKNKSPIYLLYQGYRRVRSFGRGDMYMGFWDENDNKPARISRDVEREYYNKFLQRLPGYYDDSEWWKLVEDADRKPIQALVDCKKCNAQNLKEADLCAVCGVVLIGKKCINSECGAEIPLSANLCAKCGTSQEARIEEPWSCLVCGKRNASTLSACKDCGQSRGLQNPVSLGYLLAHSHKSDTLSSPGLSVELADGTHSRPIDVNCHLTISPILGHLENRAIPLLAFKGEQIDVFVDPSHSLFSSYRVKPEVLVATEVAIFIYDTHRAIASQQRYAHRHTLSSIEWSILQKRWADTLEDSAERVRIEITRMFSQLRERLPELVGESSADIFDELDEAQKKKMAENILSQNKDIGLIGEMKKSGEFLRFIDEESIISIFKRDPGVFLDGRHWKSGYTSIANLPQNVIVDARKRIQAMYLNCLEDCVLMLRFQKPDPTLVLRARASIDYLKQQQA